MERRWRGSERHSLEVMILEHQHARAVVRFGDEEWPYEVHLDDWVTRRVTIGSLVLEHDDGWTVDGRPRPDLAEAVDCDIVITPFTNTLPIRRLGLAVGESADIVTAWIDVPSLTVVPDPQRYTRLAERLYRFDSRDSDFTADLEVDADGFVVNYPGLFKRV